MTMQFDPPAVPSLGSTTENAGPVALGWDPMQRGGPLVAAEPVPGVPPRMQEAQYQRDTLISVRAGAVPQARPSGSSMTAGAVAQVALQANQNRRLLIIQNRDNTEALGVFFGESPPATLADPSWLLLDQAGGATRPGGTLQLDGLAVVSDKVWVLAATTGHQFSIWEA